MTINAEQLGKIIALVEKAAANIENLEKIAEEYLPTLTPAQWKRLEPSVSGLESAVDQAVETISMRNPDHED